ncbi:hypothetical protein T09_10661, partial [Trichinella sp. T9]
LTLGHDKEGGTEEVGFRQDFGLGQGSGLNLRIDWGHATMLSVFFLFNPHSRAGEPVD